ncbi:hypothetical protein [Candidatus Accumulibacter sp. ACC012]|uniref:hypothetical protein n=1 Tax=Candidatus Accumulibacter sp. ACC012 TaxID=2823332 RepID=UPI0025B966EB|nr:hypothetical protein [Candidatus Accumulibacter sp. ACC012]
MRWPSLPVVSRRDRDRRGSNSYSSGALHGASAVSVGATFAFSHGVHEAALQGVCPSAIVFTAVVEVGEAALTSYHVTVI